MNDDNLLGGVLGQLGQTVKQGAKQVVKIPEEMAKDTAGQIGSAKQNTEENKASENKPVWSSDEERIKFLRGLYGSAEPGTVQNPAEQTSVNKSSEKKTEEEHKTSANPLTSVENKKPSEFQEQIADKSLEEQKKLLELRNQLHKENYYDPTFNPPKKQEERPVEKVENEKKQEMAELQKKEEKKPQPLAVTREQNKAEQFRGASG